MQKKGIWGVYAKDEEFDLSVKGYNFSNVGAFQLGMAASSNDFEFVSSEAGSLTNFQEENSIGGLKYGDEGIKVLWVSDDLIAQTFADGSEILKIRLRATNDVLSLQQAIRIDNSVLDNSFLTTKGDCIDKISLELSVDVVGVTGRSSNSVNGENKIETNTEKLFCYPNPVNNSVSIIYDAEHEFSGQIRFFDVHGKILKEKVTQFEKGRNIIKMDDLQFLQTGIINITILGSENPLSTRLVKL